MASLAHRSNIKLKAQVIRSIKRLLNGEAEPSKVWKKMDQLGIASLDEFDSDASYPDLDTVIEKMLSEYMVQEDAALSEESFLKAEESDLTNKMQMVRKAIGMKNLQMTLDYSSSPGYAKGVRSHALFSYAGT